jgi:hypothetical protein
MEHRRLAAAGGPDQRQDLSRLDTELRIEGDRLGLAETNLDS